MTDAAVSETSGISEPFALAQYATEYRFKFGDRSLSITRYDNHRNLLKGWMVVCWLGALNPWYLSASGEWGHKCGSQWATAEDAWRALQRWGTEGLER